MFVSLRRYKRMVEDLNGELKAIYTDMKQMRSDIYLIFEDRLAHLEELASEAGLELQQEKPNYYGWTATNIKYEHKQYCRYHTDQPVRSRCDMIERVLKEFIKDKKAFSNQVEIEMKWATDEDKKKADEFDKKKEPKHKSTPKAKKKPKSK